MSELPRKLVTLRRDQFEWIQDNDIQFSRFVRRCLDRAMKESRDNE